MLLSDQRNELTTFVEPVGEDPFVLHPSEFVLGSTYKAVTLPDDLAGRLEGKSRNWPKTITPNEGTRGTNTYAAIPMSLVTTAPINPPNAAANPTAIHSARSSRRIRLS